MKYELWDELILNVKDSFGYGFPIISHVKVTIIGHDMGNSVDSEPLYYLCYISPRENIPIGFNSFSIDKYHIQYFDLEDKFLNDKACFITVETSVNKHIPAVKGEKCDKCKTWFDGAERGENNVYVCRSCRENPWR